MQGHVLPFSTRKMRRKNIKRYLFTRKAPTDRRGINRQDIALINNGRIEAKFFGRAVIIEKAVPLPFHVVKLGIDVSGELPMKTELVGEKFETPAGIDITIERTDATVLATN